jgi:hypothetical protein
MRSNLILIGSTASVLLWASPGSALSPETSCENAKLRAAAGYYRCLTRAAKEANAAGGELSDAAIEHCDARFDRAFEWAEATGACSTAGGPATLRGPIRGQVEDTLASVAAGSGCPSTPAFDQDTSTYTCTPTSGSAVDLAAIVMQIADPDVTNATVVWIEAWGADGGPGNTSNGGGGGAGGYAQITTTVDDLLSFFGASEIYYYLGVNGAGPSANAGGDGGTGTIVTVDDLTREGASFGTTVIVAGGGGGGGGGRGSSTACPGFPDVLGGGGGAGGEAVAALDTDAFGAGARGGSRRNSGDNYSGRGGGGDADGSGGGVDNSGNPEPGDTGIAVIGGVGGERSATEASTGFFNQSGVEISLSGGKGGEPGEHAGGGGGGGGYGGGGGGSEGVSGTNCVSGGGGGGGSLATASTQSCARSRPANGPNGARGAVQIVFDAGSCG